MADTAYDADHLRQAVAAKGALAVIPNNRHARSNIRSTSVSMPSAISWNAASQNSSSSAAPQPASKRPPEITGPSSLSQPSSYGCGKCPHHLMLNRMRIVIATMRWHGMNGDDMRKRSSRPTKRTPAAEPHPPPRGA